MMRGNKVSLGTPPTASWELVPAEREVGRSLLGASDFATFLQGHSQKEQIQRTQGWKSWGTGS